MTTAVTFTQQRSSSPSLTALRSVEGVHRSNTFHWVGDGFLVSTYFPSRGLPSERVSPFVLMDYGPPREFAPLARGKRGVGWHPHRGFETVTLAWEGGVAHRDNAGNAGVIGPGDVQWMTAGAGIFHEEFHEDGFTRRGGRMHMMQLWVNLPKKDKGAPPAYQPITTAEIPTVAVPGGGHVRVIAGEYEGARGPARTFTPVTLLDARLAHDTRLPVALPASHNALAVVAKGRVRAGGFTAGAGEAVLFANDAPRLELVAEEEAHVVLLSGQPIDEPIAQYGPFVMNTPEEIEQAFRDVRAGKFGGSPTEQPRQRPSIPSRSGARDSLRQHARDGRVVLGAHHLVRADPHHGQPVPLDRRLVEVVPVLDEAGDRLGAVQARAELVSGQSERVGEARAAVRGEVLDARAEECVGHGVPLPQHLGAAGRLRRGQGVRVNARQRNELADDAELVLLRRQERADLLVHQPAEGTLEVDEIDERDLPARCPGDLLGDDGRELRALERGPRERRHERGGETNRRRKRGDEPESGSQPER